MKSEIEKYNEIQTTENILICDRLYAIIKSQLPTAESKIWHRSPVWFLEGNPVVGYSVLKNCVQLLFWSGQTFEEPNLHIEGSFKAAERRYTSVDQINTEEVTRWVQKAITIQWDYKNIVKHKGVLERLK
jgi:hypothetical protein